MFCNVVAIWVQGKMGATIIIFSAVQNYISMIGSETLS